jgi:hypothetical protein
MADTAALLVDEVLPERPLRQRALSLPYPLRFLLATNPAALTQVLDVAYRTISGFLLQRAAPTRATGATGAMTLVQRFGSALNLNVHVHLLVVDGAHLFKGAHAPLFRAVAGPGADVLRQLAERSPAERGLGDAEIGGDFSERRGDAVSPASARTATTTRSAPARVIPSATPADARMRTGTA